MPMHEDRPVREVSVSEAMLQDGSLAAKLGISTIGYIEAMDTFGDTISDLNHHEAAGPNAIKTGAIVVGAVVAYKLVGHVQQKLESIIEARKTSRQQG